MTKINRTAVIGAGLMGRGIAQVFARAGCQVSLYDVDEKALGRALDLIRSDLSLLTRHGVIGEKMIPPVLSRIITRKGLEESVAEADLVVEAVPERVDLKQEVFSRVEACCPEHAILATTTSVIRVGDIASACQRPERVVGTHWMNPPFVLPLVEIVRGPATSKKVVETVRSFLEEKCGKRTVTCGDTPGFLVNRMAAAVLAEAAKLVEEGATSFEDIDRAWKEHLGFVLLLFGPFGNLDYIGLDVVYMAAKYLAWALKDERYTPPSWFEGKVSRGELGVKAGKGIYDYSGRSPEDLWQERVEKLLDILGKVRWNVESTED